MATKDNENKAIPKDEEDTADSPHEDDSYVHNPEEFIDIHGDERIQRSTVRQDQNEVASTTNVQEKEVNSIPSQSLDTDQSKQCSIPDLKVPVQVSDMNSSEKFHSSDDSAEEYQSAEEGGGDDDSEDDFIPVGGENDDGAGGDSNVAGAFGTESQVKDKKEDFVEHAFTDCANEEDNHSDEEDKKELDIVDDLEVRRKKEESLTEEEKTERKNNSQKLKDEGNTQFRNGDYDKAIESYSEALELCPLNYLKERSIMFSNRAACLMKKELYEEAIKDSSSALELHPHYMKALLRRAELYEKTDKLDDALKDYQKVVELDPSQHASRAACMRLAEQIKERNEKMKEEMIDKLKDLGNLVLRPFGLSTNNFKMQQDPNTGSYSVQFQNAPGNGS